MWKIALKLILLNALIWSWTLAHAAPDISWIAPTKNTDGTTIPATGPTSLDGFKIYSTPTGPFSSAMVTDITDPLARKITMSGLPPGVWNFQMTAYNVAGAESVRTPSVTATVTSVPQPPAGQTFSTYEPGVYNLVKRDNGFIMVYVGLVPLNTPCDPLQNVNGFNAVPVSAVTSYSGTVRPIVVLAKCSIH